VVGEAGASGAGNTGALNRKTAAAGCAY